MNNPISDILRLNALFWQDMGLLTVNETADYIGVSSNSISSSEANYCFVFPDKLIQPEADILLLLDNDSQMRSNDLESSGFIKKEMDVLIVGDLSRIRQRDFHASPDLQIKKSATLAEPDFLEVFSAACYANDGQTEFSQIDSGYLKTYKDDQADGHQFRHHHYIAYSGNFPVAILSVIENGQYMGIYNVCSHPDRRHIPYALESILSRLTADFSEHSSMQFFGITAAESVLERWYRILGGKVITSLQSWEKSKAVSGTAPSKTNF